MDISKNNPKFLFFITMCKPHFCKQNAISFFYLLLLRSWRAFHGKWETSPMKLHAWTCGGHQQLAYGGGWWERHLWARDDGWRLAELGTVEQVGEGGTSLEGKRVGEKGVLGEGFQRGFFWVRSGKNEREKWRKEKGNEKQERSSSVGSRYDFIILWYFLISYRFILVLAIFFLSSFSNLCGCHKPPVCFMRFWVCLSVFRFILGVFGSSW